MGSITAYLDTSALAKWYLNEPGSDAFVAYLQGLDSAAISRLTRAEMRSLFAGRRRMGNFDAALEAVLFSALLDDIASGALLLYPIDDARFDDAVNLIGRYPEHPLRTLDAPHLSVARHLGLQTLATADAAMAGPPAPWVSPSTIFDAGQNSPAPHSLADRTLSVSKPNPCYREAAACPTHHRSKSPPPTCVVAPARACSSSSRIYRSPRRCPELRATGCCCG
jgi:predicted nucleic acid-binding protein